MRIRKYFEKNNKIKIILTLIKKVPPLKDSKTYCDLKANNSNKNNKKKLYYFNFIYKWTFKKSIYIHIIC